MSTLPNKLESERSKVRLLQKRLFAAEQQLRMLYLLAKRGDASCRNLHSDLTLSQNLRQLIDSALVRKASSIAIYGAGEHTRRILRTGLLPGKIVSVIFDDNPCVADLEGIPVYPPAKATFIDFDLLIVSSDCYEIAMLERARVWLPPGIAVVGIYTHQQPVATGSVDGFWNASVVNSSIFDTTDDSLAYLETRFEQHPLFRDLMSLYGSHAENVVLDYGCGPGDDLLGFLVHGKASRVIGVDISSKALQLASARLELHEIDHGRYQLTRISDKESIIPLPSDSIDYIHSEGVIHHTSDPVRVLHELFRVARPGATGRIMVYNRDSIWFHLYVAYERMIIDGVYAGLNPDDVFRVTTDSDDCPIARCYVPSDFLGMCRSAGFDAEYLGGFFTRQELDTMATYFDIARHDSLLPEEHREFLNQLVTDESGFPLIHSKYAGLGGVFSLEKPTRQSVTGKRL